MKKLLADLNTMMNTFGQKLSHLLSVLSLAVIFSVAVLLVDSYAPVDMGMSVSAADEEDGPREPPAARQAQQLTRPVYTRIEKVQEALEAEDYVAALAELAEVRDLRERDRLNSFEEYMMLQFYTQVSIGQDDMDASIEYTKDALTIEDLLPDQYGALNLRMASFSMQKEEYRDAIQYFINHLELVEDPDLKIYLHVAYAHYTLEDYEGALPWVLDYISISREQGEEVDMQGYRLNKSIYLLLERYEEARQLTRELIVMYDLQTDWIDYFQISGAMERYDENVQVLHVSNLKGHLDRESQILGLASQLFAKDNVYEAAMVLEKGIADGIVDPEQEDIQSFLSSCYQAARENELAISPLEKAIVLSGGDGELYRRLGILHYQMENYEEAIEAFDAAYESGDIDGRGNMLLFMADAYSRINKYDEAIEHAREAGRVDREQADTSAQRARLYGQLQTKYNDEQQKRRDWAEYFR